VHFFLIPKREKRQTAPANISNFNDVKTFFDNFLNQEVADQKTVGAILSFVRNGQLVYSSGEISQFVVIGKDTAK